MVTKEIWVHIIDSMKWQCVKVITYLILELNKSFSYARTLEGNWVNLPSILACSKRRSNFSNPFGHPINTFWASKIHWEL